MVKKDECAICDGTGKLRLLSGIEIDCHYCDGTGRKSVDTERAKRTLEGGKIIEEQKPPINTRGMR